MTRPDDAEQTPASGLPAGAGDLLEDAEPAESTATVGDQEPDAEAADEDTASPSPSTPARRPIVRIPATVQGVRTVDLDTGELSAVQPVDDAFSGIENPQWKALRDTAAPAGAAEEAPASAATPEQAAEPEETADPQPAEEVDEALEEIAAPVEEQGRRGMARTLLIALVVLVVVLVLATIVWFVLVRNGNVFAARTLLASLEALII
ncbi:hypothetical protein H6X65_08815 [Actinomyces sp. AC-19-1]|nr:hypothetical protein [Actinomyces sp. 187325]MCL3795065.1 hypothetical protein [Actinomyces sp. 217892]